MKDYIAAGRASLDAKLYYGALVMALTAPDVCASIENPGSGKSHKRYVDWCDKWLIPRFTHELGPLRQKHVFITAEELFQLRCSLIHQGSAAVSSDLGSRHNSFEFFDDTVSSHMNTFQINGASFIQLNAGEFCREVFVAVEEWDNWSDTLPELVDHKRMLLAVRSSGWAFHGIQIG